MATTPTPTLLKAAAAGPANASAPNQPGAGAPKSSGKPRKMLRWVLLASIVLVLVAGIAGGVYFVRHRGRKTGAGLSLARSKHLPAAASKELATPQVAVDLPLEPFVVNLADAGGHSYARIGLTLHLSMAAGAKKNESADGDGAANDLRDRTRDQIIGVLNQQRSADLLAPNGKDRLKQAIQAAITANNPQLKVLDIYFTQFLVQS